MKSWKEIEEEQYTTYITAVRENIVRGLFQYRGKEVDNNTLLRVKSMLNNTRTYLMASSEVVDALIEQYMAHANISQETIPFFTEWVKSNNTNAGTYVLELQGGFYYVGKSDNLKKRWQAHIEGKGSEWTKKHKPVKVIAVTQEDEDTVVLRTMKERGILLVRGGSFSKPSISEQTLVVIKNMIATRFDLCHICMKEGHFASACTNKRQCKAITRKGKRCTVAPIKNKEYCMFHSKGK